MKKWFKVLLAVAITFTLGACSTQETKETGFDIVDQAGRTIHFEKPAETAVSGYYIATSTIIGLGQEEKLVGVEAKAETRKIYEAAAPNVLELPAMGNKKSFNVEECAKTEADVVFLPISLKDYVEQLEALDMKVVLLNPETKEGFEEAVALIGEVLGAQDRVQAYEDYRIKLLNTYIKDVETKKSAYFSGSELLETAGKGMYQDSLLEDAQLTNVMRDVEGEGWSTISEETLLQAKPEWIFLEYSGISVEDAQQSEVVKQLQEQGTNVLQVPSALETWDTPGLSSILGTLWVYAQAYPENLSMDDVWKEVQAFYQEFYDITVTEDMLG